MMLYTLKICTFYLHEKVMPFDYVLGMLRKARPEISMTYVLKK